MSKQQKYLQMQWIKNKLNIRKAAKRFGYKGARLHKGMIHVSEVLASMHIPGYSASR